MSKPKFATANSIYTPSSASTVQIYSTIRKNLLEYVSPDGHQLSEFVGERIYVRAAPEPAQFPYMILLLTRTSLTAYNGYRETALLDVQCIGKPESQLPMVESAMDLADQCLTAYTDARSGIMVGRSRTRNTIPMFSDPADSRVVGVISQYTFYLWPKVLTDRID